MTKNKKKSGKKNKLTPRKRRFVEFYVDSGNATDAYRKAGYSENGADRGAHRLLSKVEIQEAVAKRRAKIAEKADITAQDVINEIAKVAFANPEDFFEWGEKLQDLGNGLIKKTSVILIKPPEEINRDKKAAIASIKETAQGGLEFKFHDKLKALNDLARYVGLFNEAEISKAKEIKKAPEYESKPDPTEGMSEEDLDSEIGKLQS